MWDERAEVQATGKFGVAELRGQSQLIKEVRGGTWHQFLMFHNYNSLDAALDALGDKCDPRRMSVTGTEEHAFIRLDISLSQHNGYGLHIPINIIK